MQDNKMQNITMQRNTMLLQCNYNALNYLVKPVLHLEKSRQF